MVVRKSFQFLELCIQNNVSCLSFNALYCFKRKNLDVNSQVLSSEYSSLKFNSTEFISLFLNGEKTVNGCI